MNKLTPDEAQVARIDAVIDELEETIQKMYNVGPEEAKRLLLERLNDPTRE